MGHKWRTYILFVCLLTTGIVKAQGLSDEATISLLTCTPGQELYARYGHTALRVVDPEEDIDITFNYGIFDFNTEHFYWKFVQGETWYELGATPTWWFMREYENDQRPVFEQKLNLTPAQRDTIWKALVINYQPEHRKYLYNFVFDNCATRPYWLLVNALRDTIHSPYQGYTGDTYRRFIRHYTGPHSWANAGINLLFGRKADQAMTSEQRLFLPEELMLYIEEATLADGSPLVSNRTIGRFEPITTHWWASWECGLILYFLFVLAMSLYDRQRKQWSWGVELACAIPYALLLLIVLFLTCFSCHPLVGFGWRLLIIPLTHLCARLVYIIR